MGRSRRQSRRRKALEAQAAGVRNLCVGCLDDQAVLLLLLREGPERWRAATLLEIVEPWGAHPSNDIDARYYSASVLVGCFPQYNKAKE